MAIYLYNAGLFSQNQEDIMSESKTNRIVKEDKDKDFTKRCDVCRGYHHKRSDLCLWRYCPIRLSKSLLGDQLTSKLV